MSKQQALLDISRLPIAAVLFDMDGLLLDTETIALSVLAATIEGAGFTWSPAVGQRMLGRNGRDGDAILSEHYGVEFDVKRIRAEFMRQYERHLRDHSIALKKGALNLLRYLESNRILLALVTSSRRSLTKLKLQKSGIIKYFTVQVCGDELCNGKPDPEGFLLAAEKLDVPPEQCLVLEDSAAGIQAALSAGMAAWWVPDQKPATKDLIDRGAIVYSDLIGVEQELLLLIGNDNAKKSSSATQ